MKKTIAAVIVIIVLAVIVFFVAGNKKAAAPANSSSNTDHTAQTSQSQNSTKQATDSVTISNFAFSPADITVKKGTTVTWTNRDSTAHTVTETDGQDGPKSGDLGQDQTYSFTYNTVGTFKYHCSIHPDMLGSVTVTD